MTKSALETGRTFATLLSNDELRRGIIHAKSIEEIEALLRSYVDEIKEFRTSSKTLLIKEEKDVDKELKRTGYFLGGIRGDLKRRTKYYLSDFKEGKKLRIRIVFFCNSSLFWLSRGYWQRNDFQNNFDNIFLVLCVTSACHRIRRSLWREHERRYGYIYISHF